MLEKGIYLDTILFIQIFSLLFIGIITIITVT